MEKSVRQASSRDTVPVWDIFTRLFHWSLALVFFGAYFSAQYNHSVLHEFLGYGLIFLLMFRLIWGFLGGPYARFKSFLFSPQQTWRYLISLRTNSPEHYLGHNPLGALMVFALLGGLVVMSVSGLIILAGIEYEGPLQSWANEFSDAFVYFIQHAHEIMATLMLCLILFHVAGALLASVHHKENLVVAMFTGRKKNTAGSSD